MFLPGDELSLAEAYLYNDFDIEGDIETIFPVADRLSERVKDTNGAGGWRPTTMRR